MKEDLKQIRKNLNELSENLTQAENTLKQVQETFEGIMTDAKEFVMLCEFNKSMNNATNSTGIQH